LLLATVIAHFLIGLFVLKKNRKVLTNIVFSTFAIALSGWLLCLLLMRISENGVLWARVMAVLSLIWSSNFFYFSITFPLDKKIEKWKTILIFLPILFFSLFSKYIVIEVFVLSIGFKMKYGPIYPLYISYGIILLCWGILNLVKSYFQLKGKSKEQIKYFALGIVLGITTIVITNGILPFFFRNSILGGTGPIATIFISAFTAYAIVKHRLMGIEVIIKKGTIYSVLTVAVTGIYTFVLFSFRFLFSLEHQLVTALITAFIVAICYRPLHDWLDRITDKIFFRKKLDYQKALKDISTCLCNILDIQELAQVVTASIMAQMRLEKACFIVRENDHIHFYESSRKDQGKMIARDRELTDSALKKFLKHNHVTDPILYDEVETSKLAKELKDSIIREMDKENIRVLIPVSREEDKAYSLAMGPKLSEDVFTDEDLNILTILARQISIALKTVELHEAVLAQEKEIARSDKLAALGKFTKEIAHEIKNPLFAVKTYFDTVPEYLKNDPDRQDFFEFARSEINRINNLANELGQFSKKPALLVKTDVNNLISEQLTLLSFQSEKHQIRLNKDLEKIPELMLDPNLIKQVLSNLFTNAIQAMPRGGTLSARTRQNKDKQYIIIDVQDSGLGISEEHLPHIFEPLYSTKENGAGLGLALTADIITGFGGTIDAQSSPEHGSTFTIRLPNCQPK